MPFDFALPNLSLFDFVKKHTLEFLEASCFNPNYDGIFKTTIHWEDGEG